jgi:transposase
MEIVLRLLRGESLDAVSREVGVTAARLSQWRDEALTGARAALLSRPADDRDSEIRRLRAKVGEMTMDLELLQTWYERVEGSQRPPLRRPRR